MNVADQGRSNKEPYSRRMCPRAHRVHVAHGRTPSGPQISADTQLEGRSINLERLWPCPRRSLFEAVSKTCTLCAPSVASRSAVSLRSIHQVSSRVSNVAELMEHLRVVA